MKLRLHGNSLRLRLSQSDVAKLVDHGSLEEAIENIDIGGPAMIRSAAKNHGYVLVVTSPNRYEKILGDLRKHAGSSCAEHEFATRNHDGLPWLKAWRWRLGRCPPNDIRHAPVLQLDNDAISNSRPYKWG